MKACSGEGHCCDNACVARRIRHPSGFCGDVSNCALLLFFRTVKFEVILCIGWCALVF